MPLRNVQDAMRERDQKGWSRKQAVAIGLKAQREDQPREKPAIAALRKLLHAKAKMPKIPTLIDALTREK